VGAGGTVGAANAARATPDGYTFFMGAIHHTIAESVYSKLTYNLERRFHSDHVVATVPQVMVVHPEAPVQDDQGAGRLRQGQPGQAQLRSRGAGTAHHLAMELFMKVTGTSMVHVPYRGAGPMMQDSSPPDRLVFDRHGHVGYADERRQASRLLAIATPKRVAQFPDLPTMDEVGIPGMVVSSWYALWAIKGHAQGDRRRAVPGNRQAMNQSGHEEDLDSQVADIGGMPPDQFTSYVHSEIGRWGKVVRDPA